MYHVYTLYEWPKYFSAYTSKNEGMMYTPSLSNHSISNVKLIIVYTLNYLGHSITITVMNSTDIIMFDNSSIAYKYASATDIAIKGGDRVKLPIAHIIVWLIAFHSINKLW